MAARFRKASIRPSGDDSFNESARLLGFLNGVCGGEFYIANLSAPQAAFPPHRQARRGAVRAGSRRGWCRIPPACWPRRSTCSCIVDSQMSYSVIGGPPEVIEKFEKRFGGAEALRADLRELRRPDARRRGHRRREVGAGPPAEVERLALTGRIAQCVVVSARASASPNAGSAARADRRLVPRHERLQRARPAVVSDHVAARGRAERVEIAARTARATASARFAAATSASSCGSASMPALSSTSSGMAPGAHRHHRPAAGHRFEHHEPEGFVRAGMHERIRRGEIARERCDCRGNRGCA